MNFIKMKCNNCSAYLEIDLDHLQAYCPYCGQKLMMDFDQLGRVLSEKEKTKRTVKREEEQTKRTQMVYEHESKEKDKDWKKKVIGAIGIVIVYFFIFYYMRLTCSTQVKRNMMKKLYTYSRLRLKLKML